MFSIALFIPYKMGYKFSELKTLINNKDKSENKTLYQTSSTHKAVFRYSNKYKLVGAKGGYTVMPEEELSLKSLKIESNLTTETVQNLMPENHQSDTPENHANNSFSEIEYFNFGISTSDMNSPIEKIAKISPDSVKKDKTWFYVIVSSVETKERAEQQIIKFQKISSQSDFIYIPSLNKYRIYIGKYSSMKEASIKTNAFVKQHPDIKPWIWKN
jgi:hypothetical protein